MLKHFFTKHKEKPSTRSMPAETLFNALVTPLKMCKDPGYPPPTQFIGSIYDQDGNPNTASLLARSYGVLQSPEKDYRPSGSEVVLNVEKDAVYGGVFFAHYGHFLLETLARAWFLVENTTDDVYFHICLNDKIIRQGVDFDGLPIWQKQLLSATFLRSDRVKFILGVTKFNCLKVPSPGLVIQKFCEKEQALAMATIGRRLCENHPHQLANLKNKIWLSRSSLNRGAIAGEAEFEQALVKEGFSIVHPEKLSMSGQIKLFEMAEVIAGIEGSAFHTLLLSGEAKAKLFHFKRGRVKNNNYPMLAEACGFDAEFYDFFIKYGELRSKVENLQNILQDLSKIWDVFFQHGLVERETYTDDLLESRLQELDQQSKRDFPNLFH